MNLNERYVETEKLDLSKYTLVRREILKDLNSIGLLLKHNKSGARVLVITNDDKNKVFSIGFKTPPYNDTGLQHILEHSTLCGSRKYPVKDPFVELCKGSLNTFLNAMTYPDKTVYPVASCNDVDFKNIMDVYMDAVFYPNIYIRPEIFKQEGWHYELDSLEDELTYNGVVYNEMKGVYSSPEDVLSRHTVVSLFPESVYKNESGGEPECIPNLSYEEFLSYHKSYYHPVNSYIYLYGDMDVQERLDYLDREYLAAFDKNDVTINSSIELQKPFTKIKNETYEYGVSSDEPLTDNTFLSYNYVVGTALDRETILAMQILDYALILAPGAKLKQTLLDKGIGTDIESNFETSLYQPMYSIIARNANPEQKQEFIETVNSVLLDIVNNGIDERMVLAGLNYYEFKYREADFGSYPKGLMYYLNLMDSWLYDENEPFMHIEASETFNYIKNKVKDKIFENLIKKYLLDNKHASIITMVPKHNLEEEKEKNLKDKLASIKASMSQEELEALVRDTSALKQYQDEPSKQTDLEKIPMLRLEDIDSKPEGFYIDEKDIDNVKVIHHNLFTNGIAYINLSFDCKDVPDELLPYIGLLSSTLGLMDTDNYTYPELTNEININCGGILSDASIYTDNKDKDKYKIMYEVKGKALTEKIPFVLDMMKEIIFCTKFEDSKRLKEIIARVRSRLESSMTGAGHTVAMLSCMSQFSRTAYYSSQIKGYGFYNFIFNIDSNFNKMKIEVINNLEKLVGMIFTKNNLIVSFTANDEGYTAFKQPMNTFISRLNSGSPKQVLRGFNRINAKTAYTSSSQVQYVARCGNYLEGGFEYTGALKVLKVIFSYDYLWIKIRVQGGAYGCMSGFYKNGDMYFTSYRDPNLVKTNEVYEGAAQYLRQFDVSNRDMLKYIIGTIGGMDTPLTPASKGGRSFAAYLCHTDYEDLVKERNEVLHANVESIRRLAPLIDYAVKQNYLCVVGNQKTIQQEKGMFDKIQPLFLS